MSALKQIANTTASISEKGKLYAMAASPIAAIAVIGIKARETINDIGGIYSGNTYKNKSSRKPTPNG